MVREGPLGSKRGGQRTCPETLNVCFIDAAGLGRRHGHPPPLLDPVVRRWTSGSSGPGGSHFRCVVAATGGEHVKKI